MERNSFGFMFLLFILLISGEVVQTHARMCCLQSKSYKGLCFKSNNCAAVCLSEGFTSGYCTKFRRRCKCCMTCGGPPPYGEAPPEYGGPPYGGAPPGYGPPEGNVFASDETSESSHPEGMSPGEAPEPIPAREMFPLSEGHSKEMSPGEAPGPSPTEEKYPGEAPGSSLPESYAVSPSKLVSPSGSLEPEEFPSPKRNWAAFRPFFRFNNMN